MVAFDFDISIESRGKSTIIGPKTWKEIINFMVDFKPKMKNPLNLKLNPICACVDSLSRSKSCHMQVVRIGSVKRYFEKTVKTQDSTRMQYCYACKAVV